MFENCTTIHTFYQGLEDSQGNPIHTETLDHFEIKLTLTVLMGLMEVNSELIDSGETSFGSVRSGGITISGVEATGIEKTGTPFTT